MRWPETQEPVREVDVSNNPFAGLGDKPEELPPVHHEPPANKSDGPGIAGMVVGIIAVILTVKVIVELWMELWNPPALIHALAAFGGMQLGDIAPVYVLPGCLGLLAFILSVCGRGGCARAGAWLGTATLLLISISLVAVFLKLAEINERKRPAHASHGHHRAADIAAVGGDGIGSSGARTVISRGGTRSIECPVPGRERESAPVHLRSHATNSAARTAANKLYAKEMMRYSRHLRQNRFRDDQFNFGISSKPSGVKTIVGSPEKVTFAHPWSAR